MIVSSLVALVAALAHATPAAAGDTCQDLATSYYTQGCHWYLQNGDVLQQHPTLPKAGFPTGASVAQKCSDLPAYDPGASTCVNDATALPPILLNTLWDIGTFVKLVWFNASYSAVALASLPNSTTPLPAYTEVYAVAGFPFAVNQTVPLLAGSLRVQASPNLMPRYARWTDIANVTVGATSIALPQGVVFKSFKFTVPANATATVGWSSFAPAYAKLVRDEATYASTEGPPGLGCPLCYFNSVRDLSYYSSALNCFHQTPSTCRLRVIAYNFTSTTDQLMFQIPSCMGTIDWTTTQLYNGAAIYPVVTPEGIVYRVYAGYSATFNIRIDIKVDETLTNCKCTDLETSNFVKFVKPEPAAYL